MSAHLHDDHILTLTGRELIETADAIKWYIEDQKRRNGGGPRIAEWAPLARRGANITKRAMFGDEPRTRTFEEAEAESAPEVDHSQGMTAVEAGDPRSHADTCEADTRPDRDLAGEVDQVQPRRGGRLQTSPRQRKGAVNAQC